MSLYASYSLIFSPLRSIIDEEQYENYVYNQSSNYGMFDR